MFSICNISGTDSRVVMGFVGRACELDGFLHFRSDFYSSSSLFSRCIVILGSWRASIRTARRAWRDVTKLIASMPRRRLAGLETEKPGVGLSWLSKSHAWVRHGISILKPVMGISAEM